MLTSPIHQSYTDQPWHIKKTRLNKEFYDKHGRDSTWKEYEKLHGFRELDYSPWKNYGSYSTWGKNTQVAVKLNDFGTTEEYWQAVKDNAAKNLDRLVEDCIKHRG